MPLLDDVGQMLENEGLGVQGTDLFMGESPTEPDDIIMIYEYAGEAPSHIGQTRSPGVQITTRSVDYAGARALIESIYSYLDTIGDEQRPDDLPEGLEINGTFYLKFAPVQEPFPSGKDESGRHLIRQNYIVTYRRN